MLIVIEGNPIAWKRVGGRFHRYDMQKKEKDIVRMQMQCQLDAIFNSKDKETLIEASNLICAESLTVNFRFLLPINKSDSEAKRNAKLWGFESPNEKPDFDNLMKFYADAATGVLWTDDKIIVSGGFSKEYSEKPRTEMKVMKKEEVKLHPDAKEILKVFGPKKLEEFVRHAATVGRLPIEKIKEMAEGNNETDKETFLTSVVCVLSEFSELYSSDLKKIFKYSGLIEKLAKKNSL